MTKRIPTAVIALVLVATFFAAAPPLAAADKPLLAQHPSLSRTHIVFAYAGDLWLTGREGGPAARLTTGVGIESAPAFSPDGALVAFSGQYDGNTDVYVVAAEGGIPRRLTYHPAPDTVVGWTPDGRRILFSSERTNANDLPMLFTVGLDGGFPEALPLPTGVSGSYSADGTRLAYVPTMQWQIAWKRYQGGQTTPVWIVSLADLKVEKIPRENSNDSNPIWLGDKIYFLSDRKGPVALFVYDLATRKVAEAMPNDGLDFKSASAGPGGIVVEQFGALHLFDLATGTARRLSVALDGDLPEVRPRYAKVGSRIAGASISPNGARAVFEARGEILTVPAEKGDIRNLTRTTGAMERDPVLVARRQVDRLLLRRVGRIRPAHPRSGRPGRRSRGSPSASRRPSSTAGLVARRQEDRLPRQAPHGLVRRYRQGGPRQGRHDLLRQPDVHVRHRLVAGQPLAGLRQAAPEPHGRHLRLFARDGQSVADHRRPERRPIPRLRPERQVPVLHGQHRRRADAGVARYVEHGQARDAERLRGRAAEGPALAAGAGKRRGEAQGGREEGRGPQGRRQEGRGRREGQGQDKEAAAEPEKVTIDLEGIGQRILALPVPAKNYIRLGRGQGRRGLPARGAPEPSRPCSAGRPRTPSTSST